MLMSLEGVILICKGKLTLFPRSMIMTLPFPELKSALKYSPEKNLRNVFA